MRKKGVSPLVASVLLISFAVTIGILVMGWLSGLTKTTTNTVSTSTGTAVGCSSASISIDDVYIVGNGTNSNVTVIIKNTGYKDGMHIISAVLLTNTGANFSTSIPPMPLTEFDKGDLVNIRFENTSVSCSTFSKIIVTTNCGGISDTFSGSPKC